ncbi:MAG: aspartate carbamoyltransferase catalytic subunit [Ruminococcaceae bacterium]|nr:aspartate carbamoyltransferase catalytic subunit [Oscillospiraceae bacterium]
MKLSGKDLLGMKELTAEEIRYILYQAETMKYILTQNAKKTPHLQGKTMVTLFYENSTRTRMSFELASKYMSANSANITASGSSVKKGETLIDTAKTLDAMGTDIIVIRHQMSGAPHLIAKHVNASVINAGDGMNEHPTQALLDLFTMKEKLGTLEGLKVAILGDVAHSRVARSDIYALNKLGSTVTIAGPSTLLPKDIEQIGVTAYTNVEEAIEGADVVMCLRLQKERQQSGLLPSMREYSKFFGLNEKRLALAKKDALVMHPGPVNRGIELNTEVMNLPQSVVNEQVTNGVAVRMAVLNILAKRS